MKALPWVKKITKKSDSLFQQDEAPAHTAKIVQDGLAANMSFWRGSKKKCCPPLQLTDLNHLNFILWTYIEEKAWKTRHNNTDELKASVNSEEERLRQEGLQELSTSIRVCYWRRR